MTQVYHWFSQKITHRALKDALNILPMVCMGALFVTTRNLQRLGVMIVSDKLPISKVCALALGFKLNNTSLLHVDHVPEWSDKRSAIRHRKIPYQILLTFYLVEWLVSAMSIHSWLTRLCPKTSLGDGLKWARSSQSKVLMSEVNIWSLCFSWNRSNWLNQNKNSAMVKPSIRIN